jgi:hypothetical protein
LGQLQQIPLNQSPEKPREAIGVDQRARFVGLRFSKDDSTTETVIQYKGAALLGQKVTL